MPFLGRLAYHLFLYFCGMNRLGILFVIMAAMLGNLHSAGETNAVGLRKIVQPDRVYSYDDMASDLDALKACYSFIMRGGSIGKTVEGRNIEAVKLGRGSHKIFVGAAFHAREYITTNYVMYFLDKFARAYANGDSIDGYDVREILDNVTFYVVPMVNPDGVNIVQNGFESSQFKDSLERMHYRNYIEPVHRSWKANARGVDLNRNFDYGWNRKNNSDMPASSGYNGPSPISEPETKALVDFIMRIKPEAVVAFHTQGHTLYMSTPDAVAESIAQKLLDYTHFTKEPIDEPYGSFQDFVDHHLNVFYACVELCPYIGPVPYYEDRFFEEWQRTQNVLPIVANELMHKNDK